ncbi:leucine-rich_repeat domain-containing protein [Hexamita inflata]|uniref:Leucine-rich repeat domain-containing protein n=1 Tax=Hexamita inflata TaxID=28002 RepID=A0AA86UG67_9EUKA|nr:leucine-rich repeat domain-containing protein [Hexamita inflata]
MSGVDLIFILKKLTHLKSLDLQYNKITDFSALQTHINLESLNAGQNGAKNVKDFTKCAKLQTLVLNMNQINDCSGLEELVNLKVLNLAYNLFTNIYPLQNLINLTQLDLQCTRFEEFTPLTQLVKLEALFLLDCQINNISFLKPLVNLVTLNISANYIISIYELHFLTKLKILDIYSNQIVDCNPLSGLQLNRLQMYNNNILSVDFDVSELKHCDVSYNKITDISNLPKQCIKMGQMEQSQQDQLLHKRLVTIYKYYNWMLISRKTISSLKKFNTQISNNINRDIKVQQERIRYILMLSVEFFRVEQNDQ